MAFGDKRGDLFNGVTSVTNPFAATGSIAVTAGDLGLFAYTERATNTAGTVTDNLGNTWTAVAAATDAGNATLRLYYVRFPSSGTLTSVSAVTTASASDAGIACPIFEGPFDTSPLDKFPTPTQNDTSSPLGFPATTTLSQADELVAAIFVSSNGTANGNITSVSPMTKQSDGGTTGSNSCNVAIASQVVSSTASVTPSWTASSIAGTSTVLATISFKKSLGTPISATFAGAGGLTANVSKFYAATDGSDAVLLFHMDGTNGGTVFTDATQRHTSIEVGGEIHTDTAQSKFGGASAYLDNDYLALLDVSPDFAFGTGDFTIDFWVRFRNSISEAQSLYLGRIASGTDRGLHIYALDSPDTLHVAVSTGSDTIFIDGSTTLSPDTWYHVAVTRASWLTRLFLNGTQEGSTLVDTVNYASYYARPFIGNSPFSNFTYIDEVRVIKGRAAWTENFTPNSSAYTYKHLIVAGTPVPDQVLLVHADDTGPALLTDETGRHSVSSQNYGSGAVTISTAQSVFGGASAFFVYDPESPRIDVANNYSDFDFGTGDFTVDFRLRLDFITAGPSDLNLFQSNTFLLTLHVVNRSLYWNSAAFSSANAIPSDDVWYHVAVTRAGGVLRAFVDGVKVGEQSDTTNYTGATDVLLGFRVDGWIDEIRVLKGRAAWSENFTPPTSAYAAYTLGGVGGLAADVSIVRGVISIEAAFAGVGGLSAQLMQRMAAQATFAGAGSLTANLRKLIGAITFAGAGGLVDNIKQRHVVLATFAGAGSLTANVQKVINALTFAGVGGLTDQIKQRHVFSATFAGAGALTDQVKQYHVITATFAGTGALTADATIAAGNSYPIEAAFAGVGGLTSDLLLTKPILAAFAGAGALSASMSMRMPIVAAFAGVGNLTASAVKIISATFAGTGALTDQIKQRHAIFATFAGAGSLAASATKNIGNVTFAGVGGLTDQIKQRHVIFATFAGASALTDQVKQRHAIFATFTGAGNLSALTVQRMVVQATFAGSSFLSAEVNPPGAQIYPIIATFEGAGNFTVTFAQRMAVRATLAGSGALTANLLKAISATFAGAGNLNASLTMRGNIAATFAGMGNFTAALIQRMVVTVTFAGAGSQTANVTPPGTQIYPITATFAGTGGFAANVLNTKPITATFAGAGALTVNVIRAKPITATFAGAGNFAANILLTKPLIANFAGAGSLTVAISSQRQAIYATLDGEGDLSALINQCMMAEALFAGNGAMVSALEGGLEPRADHTTRFRSSNAGKSGRSNQATGGRSNRAIGGRVNRQ